MISRWGIGLLSALVVGCASKGFRFELVAPAVGEVQAVFLMVGKDLQFSESPSELVQPEKQQGYAFFAQYRTTEEQGWVEGANRRGRLQPELGAEGISIRISKRDLDTLYAGSSIGVAAQFRSSADSVWAFDKALLRSKDAVTFHVADQSVTVTVE